MRESGQGARAEKSEMRDRAGVKWLAGACGTFMFTSRDVDQDTAQDQGLRLRGSRSEPVARTNTLTLTRMDMQLGRAAAAHL